MISQKEVRHIAGLARIGADEKEIVQLSEDLSAVLDWMEQLKEVNVSGVEAMEHITGLQNKTRSDKTENFGAAEAIRKLFPEEKNGYDKVKSVL